MIKIINKSNFKGVESLECNTEEIKFVILPEYGGKMASLINKKTGREFLFQAKDSELKIPEYGAPFNKYDSSGFDEVLPTVDESFYPEGVYKGKKMPDHGEVWSIPWEYKIIDDTTLELKVYSKEFNYEVCKKIEFNGNKILINYELINKNDFDFKFIWAAHLLLNCDAKNTKMILPSEVDKIINVAKDSEQFSEWGEIKDYPIAKFANGEVDLSRVKPVEDNSVEKFYAYNKIKNGECGVEYLDTNEKIMYRYSSQKIPYIGIWKTQGGYRGEYNIAVEPCTGEYDDLYVANKMGRCSIAKGNDIYKWSFEIEIK